MARKKQVLKIQQLREQLEYQRIVTRASARRPLSRLCQFSGWPVAVTGFISGLVLGRMRIYTMLARTFSASVLALRLERAVSLLASRL